MDFALPELLNREDIINIFTQRQLNVPNMNELTLDELLRVYKTFALPLSKRPKRGKQIKQKTYSFPAKRNDRNEEHKMQMEYSDCLSNAMDIDFYPAESNSCKQLEDDRNVYHAAEKRRQGCNDEDIFLMLQSDYQYQLSSVTKRIRINSVS